MSWSAYEQKAWHGIQDRKRSWFDKAAEDTWASRTGERISSAADSAGKNVRRVPGVTKATAALGTAVGKAQETVGEWASRTLSEKRVIRAFTKRGHDVTRLKDLRDLDLEHLDGVVHKKRLNMRYGTAAALEGGAAGIAVTGGTSAAGTGVAAAPGFGVVAAAMTGDIGFMLALSSRAVADTAMHYGFDPNDPREQLFIMSVINVGSAVSQGAKYTALADLSKLTQALARSAPWTQLSSHALSRVAARFAEQFGFRLTKQKLGQLVPVVGVGVGATLNYATITSVQSAAYWAYRERLLLEKDPVAESLLKAELAEYRAPAEVDGSEETIALTELIADVDDDIAATSSPASTRSRAPSHE